MPISPSVQPQPQSLNNSSRGRAKRVRMDDSSASSYHDTAPEAAPEAAAPENVYVVLKKPSFVMTKPAISDKNGKQAANKLVALSTEICGPAFASPEAAQESAQSLFVEFLNGEIFYMLMLCVTKMAVHSRFENVLWCTDTCEEGLSVEAFKRSIETSSKSAAPTEGRKSKSAKSSSSTEAATGLIVPQLPSGEATYTYTFPKGRLIPLCMSSYTPIRGWN